MNSREQAALAGQVYNPQVGFALVGNVAGHPKYPYNPYYKSFSPRVAAAWNPSFDSGLLGSVFGQNKTVIRGGYSILYGRLNGVDLVLVPLLGTGLIQAVQCVSPLSEWQLLPGRWIDSKNCLAHRSHCGRLQWLGRATSRREPDSAPAGLSRV